MRAIPQEPCLGLIHAFEKGPNGSFAAVPYKDPVGVLTIGWGHALTDTWDGVIWSAERADEQALSDLTTAAIGVCAALGDAIFNPLTDGQYAALIDFAYNAGVGAFTGSTLCRFVKEGNMLGVPGEFRKWVYGTVGGKKVVLNGLVNRRNAEVAVWLT